MRVCWSICVALPAPASPRSTIHACISPSPLAPPTHLMSALQPTKNPIRLPAQTHHRVFQFNSTSRARMVKGFGVRASNRERVCGWQVMRRRGGASSEVGADLKRRIGMWKVIFSPPIANGLANKTPASILLPSRRNVRLTLVPNPSRDTPLSSPHTCHPNVSSRPDVP
jgi:hypothetical protein